MTNEQKITIVAICVILAGACLFFQPYKVSTQNHWNEQWGADPTVEVVYGHPGFTFDTNYNTDTESWIVSAELDMSVYIFHIFGAAALLIGAAGAAMWRP